MPEVIPHKKSINHGGRLRQYRSSILQLNFFEGAYPVEVKFSDGTTGRGSCLGCYDTPCMTLTVGETSLPNVFSDFPGDPATDVCPTHAINWDEMAKAPTVDMNSCIGCGLCVARCPYGSISLNPKGHAVIESTDPDSLTIEYADDTSDSEHEVPLRKGYIAPPKSPTLQEIPQLVSRLDDTQGKRLIRNLLIECGIRCRIRRQGDTNIRMDGVFVTSDNHLGVLEIQFGSAALDLPRELLEDVAIFHGRYKVDMETIVPVSVVSHLPNARSEYFRVISDIEKVLGLRCRTVTLGILIAVLWQFQKFTGFPNDLFVTKPENTNFLPSMKSNFPGNVTMREPYPGAYRPFK